MAEPSRGFKSLRKKRPERPKISGPVQPNPMPRAQKERMERMQRRMSQKLMQPLLIGDIPPLPGVPPLPQFTDQKPQPVGASGERSGSVKVDLNAIQDPKLDSEAYALSILRDVSADQISAYENALMRMQHRNSADIQESVHKNVGAFINVSVEAKSIKAEMDNLRNYMSELRLLITQNNSALGIETESTSAAKRVQHRSSIANLEAMWNSHLQELWKRVEGSQKFLPAIAGRHVVHESGHWVELNSATLRPRRRVHLILLNDHMLVAADKGKAGDDQGMASGASPELVTSHCWALQDVSLSEMVSGPAHRSHAQTPKSISLTVGDEVFTYAATDRERREMTTFLGRFRKASADMRKAMQIEGEEKAALPRPRSGVANVTGTVDSTLKSNVFVEVDGRQETLRWVEAQVYELEIDVALQRFDQAVTRAEKLRSIGRANRQLISLQDLMNGRVQAHIDKLVDWLSRYLQLDHRSQSKVRQYTSWLTRLDSEQLACTCYLSARRNWLDQLTEKTTYEGDIVSYCHQVSYSYFSTLRNTVRIFSETFSQHLSSGCIAWAQKCITGFNHYQAMHLASPEVTDEQRNLCRDQILLHCQLLKEVNVDFEWLVA